MRQHTLKSYKTVAAQLFIFVLLLFGVFMFSKHQASQQKEVNAIIEQSEGVELDLIMTTWFERFTAYQNQGKKWEEANQMALADALYALVDTQEVSMK